MELEDIDRILSESDTLEPSSGLALRITDVIHRQAAEPAQPRFPWLRFSLGLAACVLMALFGMNIVMRCATVLSTLKETFTPVVELAPNLAWAFAAVLGGLGVSFFLRYLPRYSQ